MEVGKRIGRPPKPDAVRKRKNQTFRITDVTSAKLAHAANHNQRSVSEEIEARIQRSFERDDRAGDAANRALADAVLSELLICEAKGRRKWTADPEAARYFHERLVMTLAHMMGVGPLDRIEDAELRKRAEALTLIARQHEAENIKVMGGDPAYSLLDDPLAHKLYPQPSVLAPLFGDSASPETKE